MLDYGIDAIVVNEHLVNALWDHGVLFGGVQVQIPHSQLDTFQELEPLHEISYQWEFPSSAEDVNAEADDPACLRCGSTNLGHSHLSKRVAYLSMLLVAFPFPKPTRITDCFDCGHRLGPADTITSMGLVVFVISVAAASFALMSIF